MAHNLGNLWRWLVLPKGIKTWWFDQFATTVGEYLGRLVMHSRYYWLLLAESHLKRRLFGSMLWRMEALPVPAE